MQDEFRGENPQMGVSGPFTNYTPPLVDFREIQGGIFICGLFINKKFSDPEIEGGGKLKAGGIISERI